MYRGRFEGAQRSAAPAPARRRRRRRSGRLTAIAAAAMLLLGLAIGGTVAWLTTKGDAITNTFTPATVSCKVEENFDADTGVKTDVNVTNISNIPVFIRVKLVSYRTNDEGQHIGGNAALPELTLGAVWVKSGEYYYYTQPVAPNTQPAANLVDSIRLATYDDVDGGHQSIDVIAEAIQSAPEDAVKEAWGEGFSINQDGSLSVPN